MRNLLFLTLLPAILLLSTVNADAANHYIRPSATGTGNGSDWTNACTDFTGSCAVGSLVRGDTYYVANGSYAARTFSTPANSGLVITIKRATASAHGTDTGWNSTYGDGVATFACTITFSTPDWIFDGVNGPLHSLTPSEYGFNMAQCANPFDTSSSSNNVTISHVAALATASDTEKIFLEGRASTITVSHSLLNGFQNCMMTRGPDYGQKNNWAFEYNVNRNMWSSSANHGECLNANESNIGNLTVRFNLFLDWSTDYSTATIVANNSNVNGAMICGNIFKNVSGTNGIITGTSAGTMNNVKVYNNTFHIFTAGFDLWLGNSQSTSVGNEARNNIIAQMSRSISGNWNTNYDMFVSTTGSLSEPNTVTTTVSPFTNPTANNYTLTGPTTAGQTVTGCTTDYLGNTRGADGTWDRGALEYRAGGADITPPASPTNVGIK